jgi:hypothetical protein
VGRSGSTRSRTACSPGWMHPYKPIPSAVLAHVLTDADGHALYMFPPDAGSRVGCTGPCAGTCARSDIISVTSSRPMRGAGEKYPAEAVRHRGAELLEPRRGAMCCGASCADVTRGVTVTQRRQGPCQNFLGTSAWQAHHRAYELLDTVALTPAQRAGCQRRDPRPEQRSRRRARSNQAGAATPAGRIHRPTARRDSQSACGGPWRHARRRDPYRHAASIALMRIRRLSQLTWLERSAQNGARSLNFWILPVDVRGMASVKSIEVGHL